VVTDPEPRDNRDPSNGAGGGTYGSDPLARPRSGDAIQDRAQTLADADQTAADRDQTTADADQTASDRDQLYSQSDQTASDRDQAASDRDFLKGGDATTHSLTRDLRERSTADRRLTARARAEAAAERDAVARARAQASRARDEAAALRDRELAARATVAERNRAGAAADRSAAAQARGRAAADREQAARDRRHSARDREEARADREALIRELISAETDALTGARTRSAGLADLDHEMDRARRRDGLLAVAYVDVVALKAANDSYGHAAGDALLRRVVDTLRLHLRSYDLIARLGGDEFLCVMSGATEEQCQRRIEAVQATLAGDPSPSRIKVGITTLAPQDTAGDLIVRADAALPASGPR
jgi:diguanylate cyclase (GGDEF)-like protein